MQFHAEVANFVQKKRAAVGRFDQAFLGSLRAGKRAALIAEQLALNQRSRHGAALDRHKGPSLRRLWLWMNRAVTSLPVPLSPRIITVASVGAARRHFSIWSSIAGLRVCAASASPRPQPSLQLLHLVLRLEREKSPLHHQQQILALEGLLQVVEGAVAHGQYRALH